MNLTNPANPANTDVSGYQLWHTIQYRDELTHMLRELGMIYHYSGAGQGAEKRTHKALHYILKEAPRWELES